LEVISLISASGGIFLSLDTKRICLQLRNENNRHGGTWSFWGGKSENNEKPIDTLLRELREEIGILPDIKKIYPLHKYISQDKNFEYNAFVILVFEEFIPSLNNESSGYCWINYGNYPISLHIGAKSLLSSKTIDKKIKTIININNDLSGNDWVQNLKR
jgi:8-oxo-dGTP pyrophosphatase MutT (NUDIX family)